MNNNRELAILAEKEILQKVTLAMRSNEGPKRWFWELLQNAIDTISEEPERKINVRVVLDKNEEGVGGIMHFIHDGTPFLESNDPNRFDDFKNLILPHSGKKSSNVKTIGKFGTGFLSTHNLSLKIDVSGTFQLKNGEQFKIETSLNRTPFMDEDDKFDNDRIESITTGLDKYNNSLNQKIPVESNETQFTYHLNDEGAVEKVRTGFNDIEQSLPVVMALNSKIGSVIIENNVDGENFKYSYGKNFEYSGIKTQNTLKTNIQNDEHETYSVAYLEYSNVTLVWPIVEYSGGNIRIKNAREYYKGSVKDKMPVLYSTFPMIGSDDLKFPILIHSQLFIPNNNRDGISLTDNTYKKEDSNELIELDKTNKELILASVKLYKQFLEIVAPTCDNLYFISKVNKLPDKDWISKEWYKENISNALRKIVSETPIIDISEDKAERKAILDNDGNIQVFFPNISNGSNLKRRNGLNNKFYIFSKYLYGGKIPLKGDLHHWHNILWQDQDVIKILEIKDLVEKVESYSSIRKLSKELKLSISGSIKWLNHFYAFIDEVGSDNLYKEHAILPNQKGQFAKATSLKVENKDSKIESEFIYALLFLGANENWRELLLHRKIQCGYPFDKRSLKEHAGPEINKLLLKKDEAGYYFLLKDNEKAKKILPVLLSLIPEHSTNKETNKAKVFNYCKDIFGSIEERIVPFSKDFDFENVEKHTIRLINQIISESGNINNLAKKLSKTKESTLNWLNEFLNFQTKSNFADIIHWANVIPNQYEVFKAHGKGEDKDRMYSPYSLINGDIKNNLDATIIKVLFDLSNKTQDWKNILISDNITLSTLPSKTWQDLGHDIDILVSKILTTIVEDTEDQKSKYLEPMLTLLDWCEHKSNEPTAMEYFKTTYTNKDKLYLQLTYSPENVTILKDKETLNIAKRINKSHVSAKEVELSLGILENIKDRLGDGAIEDFLNKAEKFISTQENFNNRQETGENIEDLLKEALDKEGINVDVNKSGLGAYDISISKKDNLTKKLKIEVKSYKYNTSLDFKFANSQIIEANGDQSNYIVCTLERKPNDEECDNEYLKNSIRVQPNLGLITKEIFPTVSTFNDIFTKSKTNAIPLEIPCIEEPRVRISQKDLLTDTGDFNFLIEVIKDKLSS